MTPIKIPGSLWPALMLTALTMTLSACERSSAPESPVNSRELAAAAKAACAINAENYNQPAPGSGAAESVGLFTLPFCEERWLSDYKDDEVPQRGIGTGGLTNPVEIPYQNLEHCGRRNENSFYECKPAAATLALLPDDRLIYFNALENTENAEFFFLAEAGAVTVNDQTRVLELASTGSASWVRPSPVDGGATNPTNAPEGGRGNPITGVSPNDPADNDGTLFCAHLVNLHDGRVLAAGGTDYYQGAEGADIEGIKSARIFDPANNRWSATDPMSWGRWYPTMTTLANGNVFIASGVRRVINNIYPDRPPNESARNETHTEIFQTACNDGLGKWTDNRESGRKSLPLYPRLFLLPNGNVWYGAVGTAFSPQGQAYDEALWNFASTWDPITNSWTDHGLPGLGTSYPGFRGSTTQLMMPLIPDSEGHYSKVQFMTPGGTLITTPGSYLPVAETRLDTVRLDVDGSLSLSSQSTGALNRPRWFGHGVLLPTGEVMIFSGTNADAVVAPGTEQPIFDPELYDPVTGQWTVMARQGRPRGYHNTATLLADGRVLVGGSAPHATLYARNADLPTGSTQGHDATFEIYSPPYMFVRRPVVESLNSTTLSPGESLVIRTPDAKAIAETGHVVLIRRGAVTHLVDGDQRSVVLPIVSYSANELTVRLPSNDPHQLEAVVPAGFYMLFVVSSDGGRKVPAVSKPLRVLGADLSCR